MTVIHGEVAPGFEPVREAFAANFARRGDIGAAVCVYLRERPVVDLWGGVADPGTGRPWTRDTLQLVYSATKGATATAVHLLVERGLLDLDAPVASYWPEFAANGKADVPVRWLLSHRAGLVALDRPLPLPDALAWDPMVAALAAQRPQWAPGTAHGYHGRTWGWLVGEVVRRVSGRTPGRFFADEIAAPLGLDFFIGLPTRERHRVSRMAYRRPPVDLTALPVASVPEELREQVAAWRDPESLSNRAFAVTDPAAIDFDSPEVQAAELPSSNGIGTARSLARMYAALIGEVDGVRLLTRETLASATEEQAAGKDRVMLLPSRFGHGYMLPTDDTPMTGPRSFGHTGRGGSLAFADPAHGIAFGYLMNHVFGGGDDGRARALVGAVRRVVGRAGPVGGVLSGTGSAGGVRAGTGSSGGVRAGSGRPGAGA
ncbi:serine hydrolase domain-containing protein [Streptomyces sp. NPDC094049]|uniref:serine hydrolase domain-containing protein n=1 Tax=Streptomyces sp. NPDC094049 TaxID=3154987 RepID=UPI003326F4D5